MPVFVRLPLIWAWRWCSVTTKIAGIVPTNYFYGVVCYKIVVLVHSITMAHYIKESASCLGSGTSEILIVSRYVRIWKVAAWG